MTQSARAVLAGLLGVAAGLSAVVFQRRRTAQADTRVWHEATTDGPRSVR